MAEVKNSVSSSKDFSRVVISLENVLVPTEKLSPSPSMIDGLEKEVEMDLRILGCELIQTSGILLKLPQVAMATGQVLFQRFYYSKSFVKHNMEVVAMACVNLASKIEECPRRVRDVINTFYHIKQVRNGKTIHPLVLDQNYINLKNQVIKAERRVLKELGFCVHVRHPHKMIVMYLQVLECEKKEKLVQCAWNYMNDSFRTDVFVRYHPETIACACIYLAARQLQIPLPNNPQWFHLFMVDEDELKDIVLTVLRLYARKKPNYDKLEAKVSEMRKLQQEAKIKAKEGNAEFGTPNSTSRQNSPKNISPNPTTLASLRRVKTDEDLRSGSDKGHHYSNKRRDEEKYSNSDRSAYSRSSDSTRSISRSPVAKRRRKSPTRKYKTNYKDHYLPHSPVRYVKVKHSHKRKKQRARSDSRGRSFTPSPPRFKSSHKKHYREKDKYAYISDKEKYLLEKERYYYGSPEKHSRKHRNGHHSPSRYEKYEKYDKYKR